MIPLWLTFATELRDILQQTFPGKFDDLYSSCAALLSDNEALASTTNLRPKLDNASTPSGESKVSESHMQTILFNMLNIMVVYILNGNHFY